MEHDAVMAEMQALLASLKSTLSSEAGLDPAFDADPQKGGSSTGKQSRQLSGDLLPDCRSLRRYSLMV